MSLETYDGKTVAVVLAVQGVQKVLRGSASYVRDPAVGNCLRIAMTEDNAEGLEILLREDEWAGRIGKDEKYGCDYVVYLAEESRDD